MARSKKARKLWLPPKPKKGTPNLIMTLPPELRNRIYRLMLLSDSTYINLRFQKSFLDNDPDILCASKHIRNEALAMYYGNHNLRIFTQGLNDGNMVTFTSWLREAAIVCGNRPFKNLTLGIFGTLLEQIDRMLPIVEVMRDTGLEITMAPYSEVTGNLLSEILATNIGFTIIPILDADRNGHRLMVLALEMGVHAHKEGWSKDQLEQEFDRFIDSWFKRDRYSLTLRRTIEEG